MSDRVVSGTRQVDADAGVTWQGFIGFPSELPIDTTSATEPQLEVSLARAIELVWRVRKMRVIWKIAWEIGVAPNRVFYSIDLNDVYDNTSYSTEQEIALGDLSSFGSGTKTITVTLVHEDGSPDTTTTHNFSFISALARITDIADPKLAFKSLTFGFTEAAAGRIHNHDSFPSMSVIGTATVLGESFDVYATTANSPVLTEATLEEAEYWPYAALDASPIYNTTTGAQLQSPLN